MANIRRIIVKFLQTTHLYGLVVQIMRDSGLDNLISARVLRRIAIPFYAQFIKEGDLCFDIGANIGSRTDVFLRLGARVIAVEPQPQCYEVLYRKWGKDSRVEIVPVAIGSKEGSLKMKVNSNYDYTSSCSPEWVRMQAIYSKERMKAAHSKKEWVWDKSIEVKVTTLDKLIARYGVPSFCKIDIEGFEWEAIQGLSHPIPFMSLEFHTKWLDVVTKSIKKLEGLGMTKFNYSFEESMKLVLDEWVSADEICHLLEGYQGVLRSGDVYARMETR